MAYIYVTKVDYCKKFFPCDIVGVCLLTEWKNKTTSGINLIEARVTKVDAYVEPYTVPQYSCCGEIKQTCGCQDSVRKCKCLYTLEINDSQFLQDPLTLHPYRPTMDDIYSITKEVCLVNSIIDYVANDQDHVLDYENTTATPNSTTNEWNFHFPVIDILSGNPIGDADLAIEAASMSGDNASNELTLASGTGHIDVVDVADLIETAFDGVTITRTGAGNTYEANLAVPAIPYPLGMEEHYYPNDQNFGVLITDPPVASLFTGDSNVVTPGYVQHVFTNPNATRQMKVTITATGSFTAGYVAGSGTVVLGHSLWVNGTKITQVNGRSKPGWNVSWSDGINATQDYVLPAIRYSHTIPAGGTVTVGVDFGDSDVFAGGGTLTNVGLELRIISVSGHII